MHGAGGHPHHHGGRGRGGRGVYGGRGGSNLPPSGSMNMPSTGWYSNNDLNNSQVSPSVAPGDVASADPQHVVVVLGDGPSNSTNVASAENVSASAAVSGQDDKKSSTDPLSSMDPLRQSLPDMGGGATQSLPGENQHNEI